MQSGVFGCARGSGELPRYVKRIDWQPPGGTIYFAGAGAQSETRVDCSTDDELRAKCRQLADERCLFSIGGRDGWGPADIMQEWQEKGLMPLSFIQVAWVGDGKWQVHEIAPGVQQWEIQTLGEISNKRPFPLLAQATPESSTDTNAS
jgi:hypothetical protein